jgi:hypothetical protein
MTDELVEISATYKTKDGDNIEGAYIDFYAGGAVFGSIKTGTDGKAEIRYVPTTAGDITFKAECQGSLDYEAGVSSEKIVSLTEPDVVEPDEPDEPKPDYSMYYLGVIVLLIAAVVYLYTRKGS